MTPALQPGPGCLLLILSFLRAHAQPADMCPRVRDGQLRGTVLVGHVISTRVIKFFQECADLCEENSSCFSVNYYDTSDTCELNDRTSFHNPEHMVLKNGRYLDIHRPYTDCSDFFCSSDRVCKMNRPDRQYCKACSGPLGMESRKIKNSQLTASSKWSSGWAAIYARLNSGRFWAPRPVNRWWLEWLQIAFERETAVTKVAIQGSVVKNYWVKSYKLSSSKDALAWNFIVENGAEKIFRGITDPKVIVSQDIVPRLRHIRYLRFHPGALKSYRVMAVEVYGCKE